MEEGAAEDGEADQEGVGAVGVGADFALEASEVAADDADGVVDAEVGGGKLDGAVRVAEHEPEFGHFGVADDGDGFARAVGAGGAVDEEAKDVGEGDKATALLLGAFDKHHGGDDDAVDFFAPPVCPDVHFLLDGDVGFYTEFLQFICYRLFVPGADDGNVPFGVGHAYGAVNARGHCRKIPLGMFVINQQRHLFSWPPVYQKGLIIHKVNVFLGKYRRSWREST